MLTTPTEMASFTAICFDATGRYLAAGYRDCEIMIFDLSREGQLAPEAIRKSTRYVGRFGAEGQQEYRPPNVCRGIGLIRDRWLWFTNDNNLYVCPWPNPKVMAKYAIPFSGNSRWWKGSLDGRVLVGMAPFGCVTVGRLQEE